MSGEGGRRSTTATGDDDGGGDGGGALDLRSQGTSLNDPHTNTKVTEVIGNNSWQSSGPSQALTPACVCVAVKEREDTRKTAMSPKKHV